MSDTPNPVVRHSVAVFTAIMARPRIAALVAGVVSATGFAPLSLWPLTLVTIAILIALIARAQTWKSAFLIGWLFGVGQFTLGNNWIATAFTYQAAMPAWLGWLAVVLLSFYLAIYPALAALGAWWLSKFLPHRGTGAVADGGGPVARHTHSWTLVLAFAALWIITEWLRSWVFTGFVWNPLGVAMLNWKGAPAYAAWIGTYGLSGLLIVYAGIFPILFTTRPVQFEISWNTWKDKLMMGIFAVGTTALLVAPIFFSSVTDNSPTANGAIPVTVVQPDIPQETKADPAFDVANWLKLAEHSVPSDNMPSRLLFWSEAAIPDFLEDGYPLRYYDMANLGGGSASQSRQRLVGLLGPDDLLVTGSTDLEIEDGEAIGARNAITVLTPDARIVGSYDKAHLVPYGEYLPMRPLLSAIGLSRIVPGDIDFRPGPGAQTVDLPGFGKMGVQICYEIIFSGQVVDRTNRPDFIFNPSNDAWFGGWGPPQHFAQARLRAIEEGLPVVRATPTGISGIIAADGTVLHSLPMGTAGRIDAVLPPPHPPTLFARFGNILPLGLALLLLALAIGLCVSGKRKKP